jgi:hypothetical protein
MSQSARGATTTEALFAAEQRIRLTGLTPWGLSAVRRGRIIFRRASLEPWFAAIAAGKTGSEAMGGGSTGLTVVAVDRAMALP